MYLYRADKDHEVEVDETQVVHKECGKAMQHLQCKEALKFFKAKNVNEFYCEACHVSVAQGDVF